MINKNKGIVIMGLITLCIILTAGIFLLGQTPKGLDDLDNSNDIVKDVTPSEIPDTPTVVVPEIKPENIEKPTEPIPTDKPSDIALTELPTKPEAPEKPETAIDTDTKHDLPTDSKLTDPTKKPDSKPVEQPKPTETPKPNTPKTAIETTKVRYTLRVLVG